MVTYAQPAIRCTLLFGKGLRWCSSARARLQLPTPFLFSVFIFSCFVLRLDGGVAGAAPLLMKAGARKRRLSHQSQKNAFSLSLFSDPPTWPSSTNIRDGGEVIFLLWSADVRSLRHRERGRQGSETRSLRREICSAFTASMLECVDGSSFTTASEKDKRVDESCSETHRDCSWNCVQDLYRRNTHNFR